MTGSKSPFQRRYSPELRERAVRMVHEAIAESGERIGAVTRVARQLGIGPQSLRNWVKQADIDNGKRPGATTEQQRRITDLERENRERRRANEILKAASAFFGSGARPAANEEAVRSSALIGSAGVSSRSAERYRSPRPRTTPPFRDCRRPGNSATGG